LPGHPHQLPHFPFSSRVCPMLLRFRVGSGLTEPPSVPLPRAALSTTPSFASPASLTALVTATRTILPRGTGQVAACVVVVYTRTTRVHVHAGTHVQPDQCLSPHIPPSQIPPLYLLFSSGFSVLSTLWSLITRAGRYTLSFLPVRRGSISNGTERSSFPLSDAPDLETRTRSLDCIARLRMIRLDPSAQAVFRQDAAERYVRFHLMRAIFFPDSRSSMLTY